MIATIIDALVVELNKIRGVENAMAYEPDDFGRGAAWPIINDVVYHDTSDGGMRGIRTMDLMLTVTTSRQSVREATKRWYDLMSPETVQQTLEANPTLGGVCHDLIVERAAPMTTSVGDAYYPAIVFNIRIMF